MMNKVICELNQMEQNGGQKMEIVFFFFQVFDFSSF